MLRSTKASTKENTVEPKAKADAVKKGSSINKENTTTPKGKRGKYFPSPVLQDD